MRVSPLLHRIVWGILLVFAVSVGWMARSVQIAQTNKTVHDQSNVPLDTTGSPISSTSLSYSAAHLSLMHENSTVRATLFELTSGLRPGRGEPIPDARDVHDLPVEDISFYNWRGELLSGWLSLHTPQAPVIILTHGTPGNRVSMTTRAAFLYNHGYNTLLFDFQSYGRSQGTLSTLGMVESEDILAAISYLRGLPDTMYSKVGVLGLSMGATAAVLAASRTNDIVALVAESCPVDATRVTSDVPSEEARDADQQLVEDEFGVDITQARPIDVVHKLAGHTPIFFINGDVDHVTPLSGMYTLYQAASDPKQYWIAPGAEHAASFAVDTAGYMAHVNAFFDTYLGMPS
ncbi:MAG: hypothetical protein NVS4B11_01010 [Ktedonobacteraceae bacterium]